MAAGIDHVLLTRFNLPSAGVESLIRAEEGWLRDRVELFERYCVPSVMSQTVRDFRWLIYFDPESPDWLMELIRAREEAGTFTPLFRTAVAHDDLVADIRSLFPRRRPMLMTTNLDNDDGLAIDFVERLHSAAPSATRTALYLVNGVIRTESGIYLRQDRNNAFCSVREEWTQPMTCWRDWHIMLASHMAVTELGGPPAWLQVVHARNVSNRVHGRLASPVAFASAFPSLLDGVPPPRPGDYLRDIVVDGPSRALRDGGRRAAKSMALAMLGKDGLDRLKLRLASLRGLGSG